MFVARAQGPGQGPLRAVGMLRLLGGFEFDYRATRIVPAPAERRLLALLGLHGSPLARAFTARALWPGAPAERAAARLRATVYRARRLHPAIVATDETGRIGLDHALAVDARAVAAAAVRAIGGDPQPVATLAGSSGELLPGWQEDWVLFHRARLRQLRLQGLEAACLQLTSEGRPADAIVAGRAAVASASVRESARRALMRAHAAAGCLADAAAEYEEYRRELHARLALAPSMAMEKLVASLGLAVSSRCGDAPVTRPR